MKEGYSFFVGSSQRSLFFILDGLIVSVESEPSEQNC